MEIFRYKYIFVVTLFIIISISSAKTDSKSKSTHNPSTCPYSKIIEDIFKVNNRSSPTPISNSERAKLFLNSIAKVTESNEEISQEDLVNDIIAAINRIKNNISAESQTETRLNEAIILTSKNNVTNDNYQKPSIQIVSGIEDKIDAIKTPTSTEKMTSETLNFTKPHIDKSTQSTTTENTNYVEVLTIEPNNTHKSNVSSHNIIEVLKHLMPMFNSTLTKELHNITIIERNFNRNHSFSATKNVSTIVVTYCDKDNLTNTNNTFESVKETNLDRSSNKDDEYDYYVEDIDDDDAQKEEMDMTVNEKKDILEAAEYGMQKMHELYSVLEPKLYSMGLWLDDNNPARYVAAFNAPSEDAARFTRYGYASLQAATKLKELISAVIFAASAMPTDIGNEAVRIGSDITYLNSSLTALGRNTGLAGFGAGTRGGAGGAVWTVWDAFALRDAVTGDAARIIYIRGRIDLTTIFTGSPGVALRVGWFKSILGGDRMAEIFGGGLRVSRTGQVIIQNIKVTNALSYAPGEQPNGNGGIISQVPGAWSTIDAIGVDQSEYVWIDHCELSDDPWNANSVPESQRRHDGLLDITQGANFVSVSNSIFRNHNLVGLVGNDDNNAVQDAPRLKVTYYLNWFRGTTQRNPRVRYGSVHVLNNLYTDVSSYGVGVGAGASIFVERNVFINTRRSWGFASGVPNPAGNLAHLNNQFQNSGTDSGVPSNVQWRPEQFYAYIPMSVNSVEAHVRNFAGIL